MPGWWFTIESTTTKHFIQQLKIAVEDALRAKPSVRKIMRARAVKQRFPVSQWVEDLEKLQSSAIDTSHKLAAREKRPTLSSPSTPAILETPGVLNVLQSRFTKPSLRPRARQRPGIATAQTQGGLSSVAEGHLLLAGPGPGLGSKMGPSSRRKGPPPPLLGATISPVPRIDPTEEDDQGDEALANKARRPSMVRTPSTPDLRPKASHSKDETLRMPARPVMKRSPSMPHLRPNDRKAVKLLGMQVPASGMAALNSFQQSSSSSAESSVGPSTAVNSPKTPLTPMSESTEETEETDSGWNTPPPSPKQYFSAHTSPTTATSGSRPNSHYGNGEGSQAAPAPEAAKGVPQTIRAAPAVDPKCKITKGISKTVRIAPTIEPNSKIVRTPNAPDMFPSLGRHYFPHGSVAVLSTSEIKDEKPDNALQNVTPFFSDPQKEYENTFQEGLKNLNGKNSENQLCIEEYLLRSEKSWFGKLRNAELSKGPEDKTPEQAPTTMVEEVRKKAKDDGFGLAANHKPPSGLKRLMRKKIGDWPVYSFLLAFVRDANSHERGDPY